MCEQTEINYLDGDVVWVKLGSYWWPGQVTDLKNLPEDAQAEFQKKPLIAAVKFFQEEKFEFVKNYQQIYKYNCTQKEEFIKKGLDKYRAKLKDGANYMDKFPEDVKMAETLTNGDPDILLSQKFNPQEKPDISGLFGEKKVLKKKRNRDDIIKKSDSDIRRRVTHPRFLRESDHEIRIRQQPKQTISSSNSSLGIFPCEICGYTATRINVIIFHLKSHRLNNETAATIKPKVKVNVQSKPKQVSTDSPKRKYVRKTVPAKTKNENFVELGKRKHQKQIEKPNKKKKSEEELRDKILADWNEDTDEDESSELGKSANISAMDTSSKNQSSIESADESEFLHDESSKNNDNSDILQESSKFLEETDSFAKLSTLKNMTDNVESPNVSENDFSKSDIQSPKKNRETLHFKKSTVEKSILKDKEDKNSRLSCFDFDEEDVPEPSISSVRKISRGLGNKNMSIKKEIIKEFEMSQALKNDTEKDSKSHEDVKDNSKGHIAIEISKNFKDKKIEKEEIMNQEDDEGKNKKNLEVCETQVEIVEIFEIDKDEEEEKDIKREENEHKDIKKKVKMGSNNFSETEIQKSEVDKTVTKKEDLKGVKFEEKQKRIKGTSETITNIAGETVSKENSQKKCKEVESIPKKESENIEKNTSNISQTGISKVDLLENQEIVSEKLLSKSQDKITSFVDPENEIESNSETNISSSFKSTSLTPIKNENKDNSVSDNLNSNVKKRRGRPRKKIVNTEEVASDNEHSKRDEILKKIELLESDPKTSESDSDRSQSGRRRKPNKKYQSPLYSQNFDKKSTKTDESLSESDEKSEKTKNRLKLGKKLEVAKSNDDLSRKGKVSRSPINHAVTSSSSKVKEDIEVTHDISELKQISEVTDINDDLNLSKDNKFLNNDHLKANKSNKPKDFVDDCNHSGEPKKNVADKTVEIRSMNDMELLPPKKSQIKKFELSLMESIDNEAKNLNIDLNDHSIKATDEKKTSAQENNTIAGQNLEITDTVNESKYKNEKKGIADIELKELNIEDMEPSKISTTEKLTSEVKVDDSEKSVPASLLKVSKSKFEANFDAFQEALIKKSESQMNKSLEITNENQQSEIEDNEVNDKKNQSILEATSAQTLNQESTITNFAIMDNFDSIEVVVADKAEVLIKSKKVESLSNTVKTIESLSDKESKSQKNNLLVVPESTEANLTVKSNELNESISLTTLDPISSSSPTTPSTILTSSTPSTNSIPSTTSTVSVPSIPVTVSTSPVKTPTISITSTVETPIEQTSITVSTSSTMMIPPTASTSSVVSASPTVSIPLPVSTASSVMVSSLPTAPVTTIPSRVSTPLVVSTSLTSTSSILSTSPMPLTLSVSSVTSTISTSSTPTTPDVKVNVPVKKREKPRIIKNIALKEPMILKTKLVEKHTGKIGKHKLEGDNLKFNELKNSPKTKIMKMDTILPNNKNRSPALHTNQNLGMTKKLIKTFKSEDGTLMSPVLGVQNESVIATLPQSVTDISCSEKYIQQSSQSLVDMDLDINSMPFVLSEDVLTPESIEQMPVVISSVLPGTNQISTTLSTTLITPSKQIITANQSFESVQESNELNQKKKSGTPTILKSKSKAKPTITSIKTIVPPLTSATYKGYKVNTQALKTISTQKTPGKYVIVQTSGQQQPFSTHQKVTIPTSKGSGNPQIVQQGGKVVILHSPQSNQSGLPLNSIKALNSGKVQRIITTKQGQALFSSISPQSFVGTKTVLTSKGEDLASSPTTSKMSNQKVMGQQQIMSSKSVLTQLPGTITKSTVIGSLPQGIVTKDGIFTPINTSTLSGKTIISSKTLVAKGFQGQGIGASKNILNPLTQSLSGKTIINSQGIVTKGTVLTPITGSQVKALAAKNVKGNKTVYQTVQRKVPLTGSHKSPKIPISSSPVRSSNVMVLSNAEVKTNTPNKKIIKQTIHKQIPATTVLSQTVHQKHKSPATGVEQKIISPKTANRSIKIQNIQQTQHIQPAQQFQHVQQVQQVQQKVVSDKSDESILFKPLLNNESSTVKTKIVEQAKAQVCTPNIKSTKVASKNSQKKVTNVNAVQSPSHPSASVSITIPSLEPISHDKIPKKEEILEQTIAKEEKVPPSFQSTIVTESEKIEEPKVPAQAQIMALPTENSDGTQTYILVTVDEQGHIIPLDNNALMSLDGTSNLDGSRTLYFDSSALGESGSMDNIVLQIDNGSMANIQPIVSSEPAPTVVTETTPTSEVTQTSNQDILAAALANTDFQHEIGVAENSGSAAMTSLTQTSLINQTILQSTIIPPTEPISSPLVLETSLTLNQPIMTPLEVPSSVSIQSELTPVTSTTTIPSIIEMPTISASNQSIPCMNTVVESMPTMASSMPEIEEAVGTSIQKTLTSETEAETKSVAEMSYSISIPENDFDKKRIQTTPSMPLIDDAFNANNGFDSTNTSVITESNLSNFVTKTSEELIQDLTGSDSLQESTSELCPDVVSNEKTCSSIQEVPFEAPQMILCDTQDDCVSSQQTITSELQQSGENVIKNMEPLHKINKDLLKIDDETRKEECIVSSELSTEVQSSHEAQECHEANQNVNKSLLITESKFVEEEQTLTSNQVLPTESPSEEIDATCKNNESIDMIIEEREENIEISEEEANVCQTSKLSSQDESKNAVMKENKIIIYDEEITATSQEAPSQSYEQLVSATSDVTEVPSQSAKSEIEQEAAQSLSYEAMETDSDVLSTEPPTQSFEDSKENEASQSYKSLSEISTNAPTQSFNELMEVHDERTSADESMDDPNFPTQSYEVEKIENLVENMEIDTEMNEEGNIPSQSNDIGADGIGTSSVSTNNSGLNEDETASSSYVPETPENQERDQDQESAISTSSYEIPPCEELNIASSSVIPDTSVQSEHSSIHNNGVPEIPTSSYNLNPDSSSTHVDAVPTSSYEDQIVVEQNVSTSYDVPISMANLEETSSQNYVTDSSDERNEPTSYYSHHQEVTESYYESICKQSDSQLETNSEEEATPSYYESNPADATSEASVSYFNQEEATPSYSNHEISASYYDPRTEGEASQSYYSSSHELESHGSSQSTHQNVEATQSFYQENTDEQRLRQQGEATPTYTDRYSVDYAPVTSPLDRHDLVESSMPARSMDR